MSMRGFCTERRLFDARVVFNGSVGMVWSMTMLYFSMPLGPSCIRMTRFSKSM